MTVTLVLAAVVAVAAVVFVARPFLRDPAPADDRLDEPGDLERRQLAVAEERDRALGALKELEFDHRTGKVSDDDYRQLVGPLRRRAADALRALEPRAGIATEPDQETSMQQTSRTRVASGPALLEPPTQPGGPEPYPPQIPEPYPPPDEGTPPMPAPIPEPYPPPDEADPPRQI